MSENKTENQNNQTQETSEDSPKVYFGVNQTRVFHFPGDPNQYIEHKKLKEGDRQKYEDLTSRGLKMDKNSDIIQMDLATGNSRKVLFGLVMVKYRINVMVNGEVKTEEGSDQGRWENLIDEMDGELAQKFYDDIVLLNPWLRPTEAEARAEARKN